VRRGPAAPYAGEGPHALWHASEDVSIERFVPHRAPTALDGEPLVWAIDTRHLPAYWFPRDCPRATFWADEQTSDEDVERFLDGERRRVHVIEHGWLDRLRTTRVVAYRLPEGPFEPYEEAAGYWVAREPVEPLELVELGDLLQRHAAAEIELRLVPSLWPLWDRVIVSTLDFSGIRLLNARPALRTAPGSDPDMSATDMPGSDPDMAARDMSF
jgi:hypothetical protein